MALVSLLPLTLSCATPAQVLTGSARDAVLAYSEAKTTNLLSGIDAASYSAFSRDLNARMKQAIPEDGLASLRTKVTDKIGKCLSRQVDSVTQEGEFVTVVYLARYEREEKVTVRVVFEAQEPHLVSGLWFDSEKLRQ